MQTLFKKLKERCPNLAVPEGPGALGGQGSFSRGRVSRAVCGGGHRKEACGGHSQGNSPSGQWMWGSQLSRKSWPQTQSRCEWTLWPERGGNGPQSLWSRLGKAGPGLGSSTMQQITEQENPPKQTGEVAREVAGTDTLTVPGA